MLITFENLTLMLLVFFIGACLGSFFKLCVDRYATQDSFIFKPSYCFNCKNKILWWQNIPTISYLILRGKCFFCKTKIDINCLYSEIAIGLIVLVTFISGMTEGKSNIELITTLIFLCFLALLSMFDLKHRIIPHVITYSAIVLLLVITSIFQNKPLTISLSNLAIAYIFMDLLYFFATLIKRFEPEINTISIPLIIWTTIFFYSHNIYLSIIPCLVYLATLKLEIKQKAYLVSWIVFSLLFMIQIYKILFVDFNTSSLNLLLVGMGVIYFICEIVLYFFSILSPENKSQDEVKMAISAPKALIGGGDITVFALISLFLGYKLAFIVLFIASLLGIISHLIIGVLKKFRVFNSKSSTSQIPFVPYLFIACFIIIIISYGK